MYQQHIFICTNQRADGTACCADFDTKNICKNAKARCNELGLKDVRINQAGCLGQCDKGPVLVVYPEAVWYTFFDQADVDLIVDKHVQGHAVDVTHLLLK